MHFTIGFAAIWIAIIAAFVILVLTNHLLLSFH